VDWARLQALSASSALASSGGAGGEEGAVVSVEAAVTKLVVVSLAAPLPQGWTLTSVPAPVAADANLASSDVPMAALVAGGRLVPAYVCAWTGAAQATHPMDGYFKDAIAAAMSKADDGAGDSVGGGAYGARVAALEAQCSAARAASRASALAYCRSRQSPCAEEGAGAAEVKDGDDDGDGGADVDDSAYEGEAFALALVHELAALEVVASEMGKLATQAQARHSHAPQGTTRTRDGGEEHAAEEPTAAGGVVAGAKPAASAGGSATAAAAAAPDGRSSSARRRASRARALLAFLAPAVFKHETAPVMPK
jgi:hypothetical protein